MSASGWKNGIVAAAALLVIGFSFWISLDPNSYFFYNREDMQHWRHPTTHVLVVCAIYIAEALFLATAIKLGTGKRLWPRALVATLVFLPWVAVSSMVVMHVPTYLLIHILWTWLVLAVLVMVTLGSGGRHLLGLR